MNNQQSQGLSKSVLPYSEVQQMKLITYRKDRNKYYLNFRFQGKRIHKATPFGKGELKLARNFAIQYRLQLEDTLRNPNKRENVIFRELLELYLYEKRGLKPSYTGQSLLDWCTELDKGSGLLVWYYEQYADKLIGDIDWQRERDRIVRMHRGIGNKNSTTNRWIGKLASILRIGSERDWLPLIQFKQLPESDSREIHTYTGEWLRDTLYPCLPIHLKDAFIFTYMVGGIRKGNLINLQQRHITDTGHLYIPASEVKNDKTTINKKLTAQALEIIDRNIAIDPDNPFIFKGYKDKGCLGDFSKSWDKAREKAGVGHRQWIDNKGRKRGEWDFRWHDIRHTVANDMAERGIDEGQIRDELGHIDLRSTIRYRRPNKTMMLENQRNRVQLWNGSCTPNRTPRNFTLENKKG